MKRIIALILTTIFLLSSIIAVFADTIIIGPSQPETADEAVTMANEEIGYEYFHLKKINKDTWKNYLSLVYGSPHGDVKNDEYRYLGYTPEGDEFTNLNFPMDAWAGGYLDDRDWIEYPWKKGYSTWSDFNDNPDYENSIILGLALYYGDKFKWEKTGWYKCVQVLQPPTNYTFGIGKMWHKEKGTGKIWYIVIPMIPLQYKTDIEMPQDYSTLIIRTGTEGQPDSKPRTNMQNEALVEYRVTNSDENTGMAEIELEIKNAKNISIEGLLEPKINGEKITGKLDMSELYAFGELQRHPEYIIYPEISLDRQRWQNKKDIKVREYTAEQKSYKDAKGNYGNMTQNEYGEDHIARAIRVKWTAKDVNRPVTITSYMKPFEKEKNIENNKDIVIVQNEKYEFSCFNDYTITLNTIYKPGEPKNKCTFWMMQPIHADDELEEEFLVSIKTWRYQNGQEYITMYEQEPRYFKLNKDNPIAAIDFIADTPRYTLTIYRKEKELDDMFLNDLFNEKNDKQIELAIKLVG